MVSNARGWKPLLRGLVYGVVKHEAGSLVYGGFTCQLVA